MAILLFFFSMLCVSSKATVNQWCLRILAAPVFQPIDPAALVEGEGPDLAKVLADHLLTYLAEVSLPTGKKEYAPIIGSTRPEGTTLHGQSVHGWSTDDRKVVLMIPKIGEQKLWDQLNPGARKLMAFYLERLLRSGKYDIVMNRSREFPTSILSAMYERIENENSLRAPYEKRTQLVGIEAGVSPIQFLKESSCGKNSGVFRHGNFAFAGLLAEMGIPSENIRIVSGLIKLKNGEQGRHVWIEVQFERSGEWYELDGTAAGMDPIRSADELKDQGMLSLKSRTPTALQLRNRLLDKPWVIKKFFTPIPFN